MKEIFGATVTPESIRPTKQSVTAVSVGERNIGNMMKQRSRLQANMQRAQAEIAQLEVTGEAAVAWRR